MATVYWETSSRKTIINTHAPSAGTPNCVNTTGYTRSDNNTTLLRDFNIPTITNTLVNKISELCYTSKQMDLIESCRTFHPTTEYIFFLSARKTFPKTDHILGHQVFLNKYKMTKITSYILSNHSVWKLEINIREVTQIMQTHGD